MPKTLLKSLFLSLVALSTNACHNSSPQSLVSFIATDTSNVAIIEDRDLQDLFGLSFHIIAQEGLDERILSLANYGYGQIPVHLELAELEGQSVLRVNSKDEPKETLLTFSVKKRVDGKLVVDFASVKNIIDLEGSIDQLGNTVRSVNNSWWQSEGESETLKVQQDSNACTADIKHSVIWKSLNEKNEIIDRKGSLTVRLNLTRMSVPTISSLRPTLAEGYALNLGIAGDFSERDPSIQTIKTLPFDPANRASPQIVFYLKDVPEEYLQVAREAVLSWNKVFGWDAIDVKNASPDMEIGDPRHNIIRWVDDAQGMEFAGQMMPVYSDPESDKLLSTTILINGSTNIKSYDGIIKYTDQLRSSPRLVIKGTIGGLNLQSVTGESIPAPFISDPLALDAKAYISGYYRETIMHEVGHALGLNHNFAGSTELEMQDGLQLGTSVMDYYPRWLRNRPTQPGSYDKAAIRWAYLAEKPERKFAWCLEENMNFDIKCNTGDIGNPLVTVPQSIRNGITILTNASARFENISPSLMGNEFGIINKIRALELTLPEEVRAAVNAEIESLLKYLAEAVPGDDLSEDEKIIAAENLANLRKTESDLRAAPIALQK